MWEQGRARALLEHALVFETLAQSELASVRMWVKAKARELAGAVEDAQVLDVARTLAREAAGALRYVER